MERRGLRLPQLMPILRANQNKLYTEKNCVQRYDIPKPTPYISYRTHENTTSSSSVRLRVRFSQTPAVESYSIAPIVPESVASTFSLCHGRGSFVTPYGRSDGMRVFVKEGRSALDRTSRV